MLIGTNKKKKVIPLHPSLGLVFEFAISGKGSVYLSSSTGSTKLSLLFYSIVLLLIIAISLSFYYVQLISMWENVKG